MTKLEKDKEIYFLYDRRTVGPFYEAAGSSAWGAAALLNSIEEGLAGIHDAGACFDAHLLLPQGKIPTYVLANVEKVSFEFSTPDAFSCVDATARPEEGVADFELLLP